MVIVGIVVAIDEIPADQVIDKAVVIRINPILPSEIVQEVSGIDPAVPVQVTYV